jgi:cytochrome c oxidase accessory protein FixG
MSGAPSRPRGTSTRRPDLDTVYTINTDGSRNFLHPADVHGRWQARKNFIWGLLLAVYVFVPWIRIGDRPAVHLDIPGRNAFVFGQTFTNQDFYLVFFLLSALGFSLFVLTSLWGRVWCGYACPQTVFLEGVFRRVERWIEGPRDVRIRRNLGPTTRDKVVRKSIKHVVFLGLAWLNAHVFLSYFIPARELLHAVQNPPSEHWAAFVWGVVWTAILYFDYAWFREQVCLILCPYGRAQSAMIDADTVVIGYDSGRGEPRSKGVKEGGDCIDCFRCVAVCPTGIDIRSGLQMECIGCANCVDACDDIMRRVGKPTGLIRYDSQRSLETGQRRSFLRPRVFTYAALALVGLSVAGFSMSRRQHFEVHVLRARGLPYEIDGDRLRNLVNLHVQNKRDEPAVFFLDVQPGPGAPTGTESLLPQPRVELAPLTDHRTPILLSVPRSEWQETFPLTVTVVDSASGDRHREEIRFRGP